MADIILGNSFKIYYNTDTGNTSLQGIGNKEIDNLAAFPTLTISSTANSFETYDSDYVSKLLSEQTVDPLSISIYYVPDNSAAQYLDEVAESQQEFQIVLEYDYTDGKIAGAIVNGYINAYTDSGDKDEVVTRTYTFVHSEVVMRSMSVTALNPVYQGDYGVGSNGADVGQYQPDVPTGNSFIKVPSSQTGNPTSTDLMGVAFVDGASVAEFAMTKSGTLSLFAKNASTAWTRIYTVTQMDSTYVPLTRTINGKPLSSNVVLSASDLAGGTMTGDLTVPALTVTGTTTLSGNTAAAAVSAASLTSTGSLAVSGTTTLTGVTTAGTVNASTVSVSGTTKLTGVTTAGTVNAGTTTASSLTVSGNTTHTGTTTLAGVTTAGTVNASTVNVSGNTVLTGTTKLTGITTAGTVNATDLTLVNALPITQGGTGNVNGTVGQLTTARTFVTNLASTTAASFNGTANNSHGVTGILPTANGGTGNATGLAPSATVLATARSITTDLGSTSSASFNGSANVTPGVLGTLPVTNGGTGSVLTDGTGAVNIGALPSRGTPPAAVTDVNQMGVSSTDKTYLGVWNFSGSAQYNLLNLPENIAGMLEVYNAGSFNTLQRFTTRYGAVYIRNATASWTAASPNNWSLWVNSTSALAGTYFAGDVNTLTTPGEYGITAAATNIPFAITGRMIVESRTATFTTTIGAVTQTFTSFSIASANRDRVFRRSYNGTDTWTDWVEFYSSNTSVQTVKELNTTYRQTMSRSDAYPPYVIMNRQDQIDGTPPSSMTQVGYIQADLTDSSGTAYGRALGTVSFNYAPTGGGITYVSGRNSAGTASSQLKLDGDAALTTITGGLLASADVTVTGTTNFNGIVNFNRHDQAIQFSSSDATQPVIGVNYSSAGNFGFWDTTNGAWVLRKATGTNDWVFPGAITLGTALATSSGGTGNANGTVGQLTTARTFVTNLASTTAASFNGTSNVTVGVSGVLPIANGGTGNSTGLAATATALATARTITTNLASTTAGSFNGTANITPGVSGLLPITNGGTGASTAAAARTNLGLGDVSTLDTIPVTNGGTGATTAAAAIAALGGLPLAGGTMSGSIAMGGNTITGSGQVAFSSTANARQTLVNTGVAGNASYMRIPISTTQAFQIVTGTAVQSQNSSGDSTVSFPVGFSGITSVICSNGDGGVGNLTFNIINSLRTSGFDIRVYNNGAAQTGSVRVNYIATGIVNL